jgi:asparagine synthase (glutamine-hydrolysing)
MPAVVDFLTFGFVPDPSCIFEGCRKLPPGHWLKVELPISGPPRVGEPVEWWDFELHPDASVSDWGDPLRDTLTHVARDMAFADVPVGTFLSGGVDSSSVTAALSQQGMDVTAFTIGFGEEAYDERPWARKVVDRYGVPWQERTVEPGDIQPVLSRLLWHYDEPLGDYSYLPTYYVCQEARRNITVALSGDGADEVFAGYRKFQRAARMERLRAIPGYALAAGGARVAAKLPVGAGRRRTLLQYGASLPEMLADTLTLGWGRHQLADVARGTLSRTLDDYRPADVVERHLSRMPAEEHGLVDAMRYLDLKLTLAGDILVKVDRASMAVSLEVRPVYLHPELLELAGRVPASRLADPDQGKRALKTALEPWLPHDLLYRQKMGFHMPLGRWVGERLPDWVDHARRSLHLAEWFEPGLFDRLHAEHRSGAADHTAMLHNLMFLAGWLDTWSAT